MQLFINECSLESQYSDLSIFRNAFLTVLDLAKAIQADFEACQNLYAEDHFHAYEYTARPNEPFMTTFEQISDPGFKTRVRRLLYDELHVKNWRLAQVHDPEVLYECLSDLCTGTSIAEAAERLLQNAEESIIILNFTPSKFDGMSFVSVSKNDLDKIDVDSSNTREMVAAWLRKIRQQSPVYDLTSTDPPRDEQTVLTDITRFKLTPYRMHQCKVYEEIATGYKMYVDNLHYGPAAHIEVFAKNDSHLGIASLDGTIDRSKMKRGRVFTPN